MTIEYLNEQSEEAEYYFDIVNQCMTVLANIATESSAARREIHKFRVYQLLAVVLTLPLTENTVFS